MTAEYFYGEFKAMLNYLEVGFNGMAEAKIMIEGDKIVLSANDKECSIKLPVKDK